MKYNILNLTLYLLVWGTAEAQLLRCYRSEGRWFDPRCCHWHWPWGRLGI